MRSQIKISPNRFNILFLALGIVLTLAGCVTNVNVPTEIQGVTSTLVPTITITPSPSPSQTAVPPTRTPLTPIPTLSPEEKEMYLLGLIETNGGCELPCFLGIQPGVSTWEEIRGIEEPMYFREQYLPNDKDSIYLYTYMEERVENLEVGFFGPNNTIEQIIVDARIYLPDDPYGYFPEFAKAMSRYSLPHILSKFGVPSRVLLQAQGQVEPNSGTQAEILLLYDNLGLLVHYFFLNVVAQDLETFVLHVCPNYEHIKFIKLYLQAPDNDTALERMIGDQDNYYLNTWLQPLEKISTSSIEGFYNVFVEPDENDCFEVP